MDINAGHPFLAESHPYLTFFICTKTTPRYGYHWRRPNHQNPGLSFEKWHPDSRLLCRVSAHFTDHSYWFRGRDSLDHRLGTTRCTGNARCCNQNIRRRCCCPSNSARASPEDATLESIYIPLPPHQRRYGEIRQFHRTCPQWALRQCRRNLYCSRVEEQGVWTWYGCAEREL